MILTLSQIPAVVVSLLTVFFLVVCLSMILIVLIQRPQGGGLSGAFGAGGGSGQTAFGTKTGDVLTLVTIGIFILFLGTAIGLNFAVRPPSAKPPANRITTPEASETEQATQQELDEMGAGAGDEPPPGDAETPSEDPPADLAPASDPPGDETP